jgi:hypothetical protein
MLELKIVISFFASISGEDDGQLPIRLDSNAGSCVRSRHLGNGYRVRSVTVHLPSTPFLQQTPWLLVRKRTIPTERPPPVGEF